jgi:competence protein ComEC
MGMVWAALVPAPDLLVTGDGRHVAIRADDGRYYLLRERAGDYVRDQIAEAAGSDDDALAVDAMPGARCSPDFCLWSIRRGGRPWTVLASRSSYRVDWVPLVAACAHVDVVVSDRRLPRGCTPRWIKADREALERSGGLAIRFSPPVVNSVAADRRGKPWADPPRIAPTRIRFPSGINDSGATAPRDVPAP